MVRAMIDLSWVGGDKHFWINPAQICSIAIFTKRDPLDGPYGRELKQKEVRISLSNGDKACQFFESQKEAEKFVKKVMGEMWSGQ